jgi:hypothetical protein
MSKTLGARRRAALLASISTLVLAIVSTAAQAASETPGDTFPASVSAGGAYPQTGVGQEVTISNDGRYVAFLSHSQDLDPEATAWPQAYVKDLDTGALILASRGEGAAGPPSNEPGGALAGVERPLISGDGRYLAFETRADNLVSGFPPTAEPVRHVYRRDLQTGETALVDRVSGPAGAILPLEARVQSISADGRYVAFNAEVEDLEDPLGRHEAANKTTYVRDLQNGTTTAVDRAGGPQGDLANSGAEEGAISRDGRYVLFTSAATNLDPEANGSFQVYRRDLQTGETLLISRSNPTGPLPAGEPGDGESFEAVFAGSSDCRVAFLGVGTTNLNPGPEDPALGIYLRDFCSSPPSTALVSLDEDGEAFEEAFRPTATDDGGIAFEGENLFPEVRHLYLRDPAGSQTTLMDRANGVGGDPADRLVEWGVLAANGCRAAFTSAAGQLTANPPSDTFQVYVRQLTSCKAPVKAPPGGTPPSGRQGGGSGDPVPSRRTRIKIASLSSEAMVLDFSAAGRAVLRIRRLLTEPRHRWKLVRRVVARSTEAGRLRVGLPGLPPGRYRISVHLQGSHRPPLVRWLLTPG